MTNLNSPQDVTAHNNKSLQDLGWEIETCQGNFRMMLAHCNYASLCQSMKQQLQELCSITIYEFSLEESAKNIYTPIINYYQTKSPNALMVKGLESVENLEAILNELNSNREGFRKNLSCPLVLWVNDKVQKQMSRLAVDFKSWATTTKFELDADTLIDVLRTKEKQLFSSTLNAGSGKFYTNDKIFDQGYQLELESALRDLKVYGWELDEQLKASLEFFQGREDYARGETEEALKHYQESLDFWRKNQLIKREGIVLFHLGLCYLKQSPPQTRGESLRQARDYFEQCLEIFDKAEEEEESSNLVAKFINQLCEVLRQISDYYREELERQNKLPYQDKAGLEHLNEERNNVLDELDKISQRSLELQKLNSDPLREAEAHKFIAYVAEQKGKLQEANSSAKKALNIISNLQNLYLLVMAKLQRKSELGTAIETLEKARQNGTQNFTAVF